MPRSFDKYNHLNLKILPRGRYDTRPISAAFVDRHTSLSIQSKSKLHTIIKTYTQNSISEITLVTVNSHGSLFNMKS